MGIVFMNIVDLFPQSEGNVFSRSGYFQKKNKIKGHITVYLFFSVVTFFYAGPCIFTDTAVCPSACELRPRKQPDFFSISQERLLSLKASLTSHENINFLDTL